MILVLLGTQSNDFSRLLKELDRLKKEKIIQDKIVVQAGSTKYESGEMEIFPMVSQKELESLVDQADLIITHGGVGSITMCVKKGKKVIAIPRLKQYGEHVNNHQIEIVDIFYQKGYLIGITEVDQLQKAIKQTESFQPKPYQRNQSERNIIDIIEKFIEEK